MLVLAFGSKMTLLRSSFTSVISRFARVIEEGKSIDCIGASFPSFTFLVALLLKVDLDGGLSSTVWLRSRLNLTRRTRLEQDTCLASSMMAASGSSDAASLSVDSLDSFFRHVMDTDGMDWKTFIFSERNFFMLDDDAFSLLEVGGDCDCGCDGERGRGGN